MKTEEELKLKIDEWELEIEERELKIEERELELEESELEIEELGLEIEEWERKIEEWERKIIKAFFEYARNNELSAVSTSHYLAKRILPDESLILKQCIIMDLIESGTLQIIGEKWIIKG